MTFAYRFCQLAARGAAKALWGVRVEGLENLPREGPVIVAANHISLLDPPLLGGILPRETGFVAKAELFAVPVLGRLIRALNAIPIDRSRLSLETMEGLARFLDRGKVLLFFPEGTRSRDGRLGRPKVGIGVLLRMRPVPVVPVLIEGTRAPWRNLFRRGRVRVVFGPAQTLPGATGESLDERAESRRLAETVLERIRALKEDAESEPRETGPPSAAGAPARAPWDEGPRIREEGMETQE